MHVGHNLLSRNELFYKASVVPPSRLTGSSGSMLVDSDFCRYDAAAKLLIFGISALVSSPAGRFRLL